MLKVNQLYVGYYRDLNILQDLSVNATPGQITTILGANGVGKSTALRAIFGFLKPNRGEILIDDKDVTNIPPYHRIQLGMAYIPQQPGIFGEMSVEENIALGAWTFRRDMNEVRARIEQNYDRFPVLREKRQQKTGELSGGQQRMVEIARTLMSRPRILLVDEPTAGLSKMLAEEVYQMLVELRDRDNLAILLVDQEIRHALAIADYVYVLELGRNKYEGPAAEFTDLEKAFWVA